MAANPGTRQGEKAYTIERALGDAAKLLEKQFGDADQDAAVSLATFLYGAHERDEFIRREEDVAKERAYGGGSD